MHTFVNGLLQGFFVSFLISTMGFLIIPTLFNFARKIDVFPDSTKLMGLLISLSFVFLSIHQQILTKLTLVPSGKIHLIVEPIVYNIYFFLNLGVALFTPILGIFIVVSLWLDLKHLDLHTKESLSNKVLH